MSVAPVIIISTVAANANNPYFAVGIVLGVIGIAIWSLVSFIIDTVRNIISKHQSKQYALAHRCKGITLKGSQCSIYDCSITHKSYLD